MATLSFVFSILSLLTSIAALFIVISRHPVSTGNVVEDLDAHLTRIQEMPPGPESIYSPMHDRTVPISQPGSVYTSRNR